MLDALTLSLLLVIVLAVVFDYINGFHDSANAIATSVATQALRPRTAVLMAATMNFAGAFAGTAVAKTIGAGLVDVETTTGVLGGVHSLRARFQRRPEDHGHHDPGPPGGWRHR